MELLNNEQIDKIISNHKQWVDSKGQQGSRADLSGQILAHFKLNHAVLDGAILKGTDFKGADLSWASLDEADLTNARLVKASLKNASLVKACLAGADLSETDIRYADMAWCDLRGVKMNRTPIAYTIFYGIKLLRSQIDDFHKELGLNLFE
jgi:uncharacterized protein YjbI with pentapeptide repeats